MPRQVEYLKNAIPHGPTLKRFLNRNTLHVFCLGSMQLVNHVAKFLVMRHAITASTKSPTVQNERSRPAAMAGVQRRVLWRRTKL